MREGAKCINPSCRKPAETRGLCDTCYSWAKRLIKAGKLSWEELEAAGKALPPQRAPSTAKEWLLEVTKRRKK